MSDTSKNLLLGEGKNRASKNLDSTPELSHDCDSDPVITKYRWIVFIAFGVTLVCIGAISSYHNYLEGFLVNVSLIFTLDGRKASFSY